VKKTLIFGASNGGINFMKNSQENREYLVFVDNDTTKYKKKLQGLQVISPNDILNYDYDEIVVASLWSNSIVSQLINDFQIQKEKIYVPEKSLLMDNIKPFEDETTLSIAHELVIYISQEAIKRDILLYINNGTLLGIIRDNSILKWDTDIDFAILDRFNSAIDLENFLVNTLKQFKKVQFEVSKMVNSKGDVLSFLIKCFSSKIISFPISIELMGLTDVYAIELVSLGQFRVPKKYVLNLETYIFDNQPIFIPNNVEKYLKYIYGDWKIPRKNMSFSDYDNYAQISLDIFQEANIKEIKISTIN
jgi:hypothetical protein